MDRPLIGGGGDDDDIFEQLQNFKIPGVVQCCGCLSFVLLTFTSSLLGSLNPNEFGIVQNTITGTIESGPAVRGGLHYLGPFKSYIEFPATCQTIDFSGGHYADRPAVRTRTGADPSDPDSGGQPIDISVSFQYLLHKDHIYDVYMMFGSERMARQRYVLLGNNQVSNIAQKFTPQDFWTKRDVIAETLRQGVNHTLWELGYAQVPFLQIMRVDFDQKFEDTITAVQVAEQQKVVNEYRQEVEVQIQRIKNMQAKVSALRTNITAAADAQAAETEADARRDAFTLQQTAKALAYKRLKEKLHFNEGDMNRYFEIKAIAATGATQGSNVVVGLPAVRDEV